MSKFKKTKNPEEISPEALIKDTEKIFSFIDKFESLDLTNLNSLDKFQKEINNIQETFKNKYKDYLDEEDLNKFKEDLDIKE